ncbi:DUF6477 family protein [Amaricoccus macauensis]|uniref:DUF6477 family protein n=1 Tax=Amaricoccus macauensis TaxID=57001 RepID=UPI003C7AAE26
MTDTTSLLSALRRPRILIRAARAGVAEYRRERDLKRFIKNPKSVSSEAAFNTLLGEEMRIEMIRARGDATYSVQRHVAVLTALIAEARHQPALRGAPEAKSCFSIAA